MGKQVTINKKELACLVCGANEFNETDTKLNTRLGAWNQLFEIAAPSGKAYICTNCGFKAEFYKE
jgi:predicted nucleic-acid-binding Zn-ribbon protein